MLRNDADLLDMSVRVDFVDQDVTDDFVMFNGDPAPARTHVRRQFSDRQRSRIRDLVESDFPESLAGYALDLLQRALAPCFRLTNHDRHSPKRGANTTPPVRSTGFPLARATDKGA